MAAYALAFCAALPALLVWWASATRDDICLTVLGPPGVGAALMAVGGGLMLAGAAALWSRGGGLPMNAFPPPRLVATGIYGLIPHPIYVGFSLAVAGTAIFFRSPGGLWLVTPTVALGCTALTLGYETHDLRERFGPAAARACRWLPDASDEPPEALDYVRCYLFLFLPWIALYELVISIGVPHDAVDVQFAFERAWPIVNWTEALYASIYVAAAIAPLLAPTRRALRLFMIRGWIATALIMPLYLALPTLAPRRPLAVSSPLTRLLAWERHTYPPVAALPSFHAIWAVLIAALVAPRRAWDPASLPAEASAKAGAGFGAWRASWWTWVLAVTISCVTIGMHALVDVIAGLAAGAVLLRIDLAWDLIRQATEHIANSWREWRIGPVRIINHGFYAGLGTFACLTIVGFLVGPQHVAVVLFSAVVAVIGAALWAQWIEGSPHLLRPYGFYGGFAGIGLASLAAPAFGVSPWLMLAAYSVGSPFVQSIGRLRCLVQGCCHGRPSSPAVGIRYLHARSRVCRLSPYGGVPVHATPLYSILWNGFVALVLCRLWMVGAPLHLIAGVFAIATGIGRFAEEAYRGEPQTPVVGGLRLYQWVAIATVLMGILFTALGHAGRAPVPVPNWTAPAVGALFGAITTIAFGVDFPESTRRFARLT
jgi:prolipoprotein diacylglyceryltransferase/protein-S-isoprenylcysteine O-methyltransferase Ste14